MSTSRPIASPHPDDAPPAGGRVVDEFLAWSVAVVPLIYAPGFYAEFVAPRELFVLGVVGPAAWAAAVARRDALARAAAPLAALGLFALGGALPAGDVVAALRTILPPAVFLLAGAALGPDGVGRLLRRTAVGAAAAAAIGFARRHAGVPGFLPDRADVGLASTVGNSNAFAELLAPVAAAAFAYAAAGVRRTRGLLVAAGVAAAGLVGTRSLGGFASLGGGLLPAAAMFLRRPRAARPRRRATIFGAAAVVVAFVAALATPWAAPLRAEIAAATSTLRPSHEVRLRTWDATAALCADRPFGVGAGRFDAAFVPYRDPREWRLSGVDSRVDHPHQEFLAAAAEGGVLGAAAFVLLALLLFRRGAAALRDPATRAAGAALLAAAAAFALLCLVRAPFRHPSGTALVCALAGALGAAGPSRVAARGVRGAALAVVALALASGLLAAGRDAAGDRALKRAVDALNAGKGYSGAGDSAAAAAAFARAGESLREAAAAPTDAYGADPARLYRAALAADELAQLRAGLAAAGETAFAEKLPDEAAALRFADAVLAAFPFHPGAITLKASLERRAGRTLAAELTLRDALRATPRAVRHRANLAAILGEYGRGAEASPLVAEKLSEAERLLRAEAELGQVPGDADRERIAAFGLALGGGAEEFGRLLAPSREDPPPAALEAAAAHEAAGRLPEARRALLVALYDAPDDGRLLDALARVDYALARKAPTAQYAEEAALAFARSRVRFAIEEERAAAAAADAEDAAARLAQARTFVRLASQKNPRLLEARFLAARLAARAGDSPAAHEAVAQLRRAAGDDAFVDRLLAADPTTAAAFRASESRPR